VVSTNPQCASLDGSAHRDPGARFGHLAVIGFLDERPVMATDSGRSRPCVHVPLAELLAEGTFLEERWRRELARPGADADGYFPIYFYRVPGDLSGVQPRAFHRVALRRHRRRLARGEEGLALESVSLGRRSQANY